MVNAKPHVQPAALLQTAPLVLTVPGLDGAGPGHWLSRWEAADANIRRVDLVDWSEPNRNQWVNRLNLAIHHAGRPVILVAHGVGCLTVAWWAHYETPAWGDPVVAALLVSPPDVDGIANDPRQAVFRPTPLGPLPFASLLVSGGDDPQATAASHARAARMASFWGSELVDGREFCHEEAAGPGEWTAGRDLLARLARHAGDRPQVLAPERPIEPALFSW